MLTSGRHTDQHPVRFTNRVLEHHKANARFRKRGSREDLHCLSRSRSGKRRHPRPGFSDDMKPTRLGPFGQRIAVNGRTAKCRHVGVRQNFPGEAAPKRPAERHADRRQWTHFAVNQRPDLIDAQHGIEPDFQMGTSALRRFIKCSSILMASVRCRASMRT